jgi:hypothetical protein
VRSPREAKKLDTAFANPVMTFLSDSSPTRPGAGRNLRASAGRRPDPRKQWTENSWCVARGNC